MTAKEKASNLFEYYKSQINESDFHIPEFISGISIESEKYSNVLIEHTRELAKNCSLIAAHELIEFSFATKNQFAVDYWQEVKQEIEKL